MKKQLMYSAAVLLLWAVGEAVAQTHDQNAGKAPTDHSTQSASEAQEEAKSLRGRVLTSEGKPLPLATVALLGEGGALLDGSVAGEDGSFVLSKGIEAGQRLRAQMLGYETLTLDLTNPTEPLELRLSASAKTLQAVEVEAQKGSAVQLSGTSLTASVASTSLSRLPSLTHILSALPFVTATNSGVEVQGRGVPLIYYGHRLISYDELLRLMPTDVKDIEVILVPDASYPAGTPAVIKIKPKSILSRRLGVYSSAEVMKVKDFGYSLMAQGYYDTPKLSLKLGAQNSSSVSYNEQEIKFIITDEAHPTISDLTNQVSVRNTHIALWADAVYRLREGHELGAKYTLATLTGIDVHVPIEASILRSTGERRHYTALMTKQQVEPLLVNYANVYYHGALSPRWRLHGEGSFNQKKQHLTQDQEIRYTEPAGLTDSDHSRTRSVGNSWAWRAYGEYTLGSGHIQLGQDGSMTTFSQSYRQITDSHKTLLPDTDTEHTQTNLGLFASWAHRWGQSLTTQLGLRLESQRRSSVVGGKARPAERQLYLFPSASVSYTKGRLSAGLSYENLVENPSYEALSAEVMYVDELTLQSGNPDLKPMVSNKLSLNTGYGDWTLTSMLAHTTNMYEKVMRRYEVDPRLVNNREENLDILVYRFGLAYSPKIGGWRPTWSIDFYGQDLRFEGRRFNKPKVYLWWKNLLSLPYDFTLQGNLWIAPTGQDTREEIKTRWKLDLSLSKQIGHVWRIALSVDDVFASGTRRSIQYEPVGMIENTDHKRYPYLSLSVSYNFQSKVDRYRGGTAGQAERSRL